MIKKSMQTISKLFPAPPAHAHCDGPCGVYDPASARIAAEAVVSMTNKMLALEKPDSDQDPHAMASYLNTMSRYINIKEEPNTPVLNQASFWLGGLQEFRGKGIYEASLCKEGNTVTARFRNMQMVWGWVDEVDAHAIHICAKV